MKNLKIAFLALAIATSFAACKGNGEATEDTTKVETTTVDTLPDTTGAAADTTGAAADTTKKM